MRAEKTIVAAREPAAEFTGITLPNADLVFYFLSPDYPHKEEYFRTLKKTYPSARLVGCTTGGEIAGNEALINTAVSSAVKFKSTKTKIAQTRVSGVLDSYEAGKKLAAELDHPDLRLIFVLSDGLKTNGSELVRGITEHAHGKTILTGGLAGDGTKFIETGVGVDALPQTGTVAAIGFYGDKLRVSYGTAGGWVKFGPTRRITRSKGNVLYELDGKNALELYKKYLGEEAKNLPGSGQFFPLSIRPSPESEHEIVRAFLGIDEKEQSLLFAGDVPEGYSVQLMRGNVDNLVDGATQAASYAMSTMQGHKPENSLSLLVSCVGRNMMMKQHVSNEIEAVKQVLGGIPLVGFYSYGEICHHSQTGKCAMHNQTMTITILSEDE
jgi:hypothetical protein